MDNIFLFMNYRDKIYSNLDILKQKNIQLYNKVLSNLPPTYVLTDKNHPWWSSQYAIKFYESTEKFIYVSAK